MTLLNNLRSLTAAVALLGAAAGTQAAPTLWLSTGNPDQLATVDVPTGATTLIGNTGVFLTDIAFDPTGALYGISFTSLYSVNQSTGAATLIGSLGAFSGTANALVFDASGTLYMAGSTLYTVNTSTGAASAIGGGIGFQSGGDLAFVGGDLFMASSGGDLVDIDVGTGVGTVIGALGAGGIFGLATPDNVSLFGLGGQNVYSINTATGAATLVSTFNPALGFAAGSAFRTESGARLPEPGSMALMGLGLLLAAIARKRRATV